MAAVKTAWESLGITSVRVSVIGTSDVKVSKSNSANNMVKSNGTALTFDFDVSDITFTNNVYTSATSAVYYGIVANTTGAETTGVRGAIRASAADNS